MVLDNEFIYTKWKCKPKDCENNILKEPKLQTQDGGFVFANFFIFLLIFHVFFVIFIKILSRVFILNLWKYGPFIIIKNHKLILINKLHFESL